MPGRGGAEHWAHRRAPLRIGFSRVVGGGKGLPVETLLATARHVLRFKDPLPPAPAPIPGRGGAEHWAHRRAPLRIGFSLWGNRARDGGILRGLCPSDLPLKERDRDCPKGALRRGKKSATPSGKNTGNST
jgi:hypothetical protein